MDKNRMFEMEWPDLGMKVAVTMMEKEAPKLCDAIWNAFPFESVTTHLYVSGQALSIPTQIYIPEVVENTVTLDEKFKPGYISYSGLSLFFVVGYGKLTEPMNQSVFAKVNDEDLKTLTQVGVKVWENTVTQAWDPTTNRYGKRVIKVICRKKEA